VFQPEPFTCKVPNSRLNSTPLARGQEFAAQSLKENFLLSRIIAVVSDTQKAEARELLDFKGLQDPP
jgi:hypothetical protein